MFFTLILSLVVAQGLKSLPDSSQAPDTSIVPFEGEISLDSRLSSSQVVLGDTVVLEISISWSGSNENYVFWAPETPKTQGVAFSHRQTVNQKKSTASGYESKTVFRLFFVGETPGDGEIGEMDIKYLARGAKDFAHLAVRTERVKVVPAPLKLTQRLLFKIIVLVVLLGLLAFGYWRIRRQQKARLAKQPVKTPKDIALERLSQSQRKRIEGDITGYYHEILGLVLDYLRSGHGMIVEGKSLELMLAALERTSLPQTQKEAFGAIFKTCDELRFSGLVPEAHEIDLFERKVKDLIQEIKS